MERDEEMVRSRVLERMDLTKELTDEQILEVIREEICSYLEFLGITIDEVKNREQEEAVRISDGTSRVNVLVIKTNEELEIAREAAELVRGLKKEE